MYVSKKIKIIIKNNHKQNMMCDVSEKKHLIDTEKITKNASSNNIERVGEVGGIMFK